VSFFNNHFSLHQQAHPINPVGMIRAWIKSLLPRSLFGRAMVILVVPVVVIQVVVAAYFAERLFRDVSTQMSSNVALEINYVASLAKDAPDRAIALTRMRTAANSLNMFVRYATDQSYKDKHWMWLSLSDYYINKTLISKINNLLHISIRQNTYFIHVLVKTDKGPVKFSFSRTRASARNPHQLLVAMILTALIFTGISILFLNNQIKPIRRLSEAAEAFGRGWSIPFNPRGAREVRSAGHSFLAMRARIIRQIEQRTMMLSGVSHDLRTPLTRMKLSLSLIEPTEEVEDLKRDVDEMEAMLSEFLEFARGDSEETTETVPIQSFAMKIVRNFSRAAHDVELIFIGENIAEVTLKCRKQAVQRAIDNLIGNAIRYGENACLTVDVRNKRIAFIVEDDGLGIPKDKRESALEPFSRLDIARNQNDGSGSGLGLAIATDVARSHGGKLKLSDSDKLGGLKASLILPR
jgi:two-component system osmolarity sensor histidine kinase EnvZ